MPDSSTMEMTPPSPLMSWYRSPVTGRYLPAPMAAGTRPSGQLSGLPVPWKTARSMAWAKASTMRGRTSPKMS